MLHIDNFLLMVVFKKSPQSMYVRTIVIILSEQIKSNFIRLYYYDRFSQSVPDEHEKRIKKLHYLKMV